MGAGHRPRRYAEGHRGASRLDLVHPVRPGGRAERRRCRTAASIRTCCATARSTARAEFITTPGIPLLYALDVQLDRILGEGMEARWERHERLYRRDGGVGRGPRSARTLPRRTPGRSR